MCVKLSPRDLNFGFYSSHPIIIYTCEVTTTSKVCGGKKIQDFNNNNNNNKK